MQRCNDAIPSVWEAIVRVWCKSSHPGVKQEVPGSTVVSPMAPLSGSQVGHIVFWTVLIKNTKMIYKNSKSNSKILGVVG